MLKIWSTAVQVHCKLEERSAWNNDGKMITEKKILRALSVTAKQKHHMSTTNSHTHFLHTHTNTDTQTRSLAHTNRQQYQKQLLIATILRPGNVIGKKWRCLQIWPFCYCFLTEVSPMQHLPLSSTPAASVLNPRSKGLHLFANGDRVLTTTPPYSTRPSLFLKTAHKLQHFLN